MNPITTYLMICPDIELGDKHAPALGPGDSLKNVRVFDVREHEHVMKAEKFISQK